MILLRVSNRILVAFLVAADAAIFAGGAWLERYSLSVAADPRSSAVLILSLLLANLVLLVLLFGAVSAATIGLARIGRTISAFLRR